MVRYIRGEEMIYILEQKGVLALGQLRNLRHPGACAYMEPPVDAVNQSDSHSHRVVLADGGTGMGGSGDIGGCQVVEELESGCGSRKHP